MAKGKRKRQREERREGKGRLAEADRVRREQREREDIGRSAVENAKVARADKKPLRDPFSDELGRLGWG
jgi:hypothetical protein